MKKLIVILLLLCVPALCMADDSIMQTSLTDYESLNTQLRAEKTAYFYNENNAVTAVAMVIKAGICIWGFQQRTTYGTVTGIVFGLGACGNFIELAF